MYILHVDNFLLFGFLAICQRLVDSMMKEEVAILKWSESQEDAPGCNRGLKELKGLLVFPGGTQSNSSHKRCWA